MKAVILAAGYGTRLQRDVLADSSGRFSHLAGVAKPLLPVGRCALVSHWARALTASSCADRIYVVTNALYQSAFEEWAAQFSNVKIVSDQTRSNDERLGAVACLQLAVKHFQIEDHVVVIGGDTLFKEDFSLAEVKEKCSELQAKCDTSCLVLSYQCKDEETQKYGILEVDSDCRATCMKEKPLPSETTSRRAIPIKPWAAQLPLHPGSLQEATSLSPVRENKPVERVTCPCFYVFSKKSLPLLDTFLEEKKEAPIEEKDAPGNFVSWIIPRTPVYIHEISGRFDVGNLPSYNECDHYFKEKLHNVESYMV